MNVARVGAVAGGLAAPGLALLGLLLSGSLLMALLGVLFFGVGPNPPDRTWFEYALQTVGGALSMFFVPWAVPSVAAVVLIVAAAITSACCLHRAGEPRPVAFTCWALFLTAVMQAPVAVATLVVVGINVGLLDLAFAGPEHVLAYALAAVTLAVTGVPIGALAWRIVARLARAQQRSQDADADAGAGTSAGHHGVSTKPRLR